MASKRQSSNTNTYKWVSYTLGVLLFLWLFLSFIFDKSPRYILSDVVEIGLGNKDKISKNDRQWELFLLEKDKSIDSLKNQIQLFSSILPAKSATVLTDGNGLNMRAVPDINGEVITKIPDNSVVEIIFADPDERTIDGFSGRWVKAKYNNTKGWLWSKYLKFNK